MLNIGDDVMVYACQLKDEQEALLKSTFCENE